MNKQEELQQDHETASGNRTIRFQEALANIPSEQAALTTLNDELDAQLKIEDFIVKSREANHPKFKAWGSIALSGAGIVISLAVGFASLFNVIQTRKTYTLEERKAQADLILKAIGKNEDETQANLKALMEVGLLRLDLQKIEILRVLKPAKSAP